MHPGTSISLDWSMKTCRVFPSDHLHLPIISAVTSPPRRNPRRTNTAHVVWTAANAHRIPLTVHARTLPVRVDGFFHSCFSGHRQRAQPFFPNPVASQALYVYRWKTSPKGVVLIFHFRNGLVVQKCTCRWVSFGFWLKQCAWLKKLKLSKPIFSLSFLCANPCVSVCTAWSFLPTKNQNLHVLSKKKSMVIYIFVMTFL